VANVQLPKFAVTVYDVTMGCNHLAELMTEDGAGALHYGTMYVRDWIGLVNTLQKNICVVRLTQ
jgi:hypothetical protein